jgi:hypothetical protein
MRTKQLWAVGAVLCAFACGGVESTSTESGTGPAEMVLRDRLLIRLDLVSSQDRAAIDFSGAQRTARDA